MSFPVKNGEKDEVGRVVPHTVAKRQEFLRGAVPADPEVDDLQHDDPPAVGPARAHPEPPTRRSVPGGPGTLGVGIPQDGEFAIRPGRFSISGAREGP